MSSTKRAVNLEEYLGSPEGIKKPRMMEKTPPPATQDKDEDEADFQHAQANSIGDIAWEDDDSLDFKALDKAADDVYATEQQLPLEPISEQADLSVWQRCTVSSVENDKKTYDLLLKLLVEPKPTQAGEKGSERQTAYCRLQGNWNHTRVQVGDTVSVLAVWSEQLQSYVVNMHEGLIVTQPDTLISGTSVVGSLFCRRKAVLQERFRGIETGNKAMILGSLVHEVLQAAIKHKIRGPEAISTLAKRLLKTKLQMLYGSLDAGDGIEAEVLQYSPHIASFFKEYIDVISEPPKDNYQGMITDIPDIEENIWVPQLGLKGKVDLTVRIAERKQAAASPDSQQRDIVPLEIKTGRASYSAEHKGQVILYNMMFNALGRTSHKGLLLYLREGMMREVSGSRNEERDLIILRNDLAHYLAQTYAAEAGGEAHAVEDEQPIELPEPISHHNACGKCGYNTICCAFAKTDSNLQLHESHPLLKVMAETTAHLQPLDYEYFLRWCRLLMLEEKESTQTDFRRAMWTQTPEVRAQNGRALLNLQMRQISSKSVPNHMGEYRPNHVYEFTHKTEVATTEGAEKQTKKDFTLFDFSVGEYVIISTAERLALATGFILCIRKHSITLTTESETLLKYKDELFIMDKHESQTNMVFNFTNLGLLMENNERANELRDIVMKRVEPKWQRSIEVMNKAKILDGVNKEQREAITRAVQCQNYMLIKGLPGTGKTQTLVSIVRYLSSLGKSILITSHTHSAVDNLMLRLLPHFPQDLLRLGPQARIHPDLWPHCEALATARCLSEEDLALTYASYSIVGVTCMGAAHAIFVHREFDYCIVDEATQVLQSSVLRPLLFSRRFILVGDPDQLPPLVRSQKARQAGADETLFQRLDSKEATCMLTYQYRMNRTITKLANHLTYADNLKCGDPKTEKSTIIAFPATAEKWLMRPLHTHLEQSVFWLDTGACAAQNQAFIKSKFGNDCQPVDDATLEAKSAAATNNVYEAAGQREKRISKYINYCEAAIIFQILKHLLASKCDPKHIGIMAPYRAQVLLLQKLKVQYAAAYEKQQPKLKFTEVEVNTVDQYQGRDKGIIIYSGTKTTDTDEQLHDMSRSREAEILEDKRRLTVAITRARSKLIFVGDLKCLSMYTPFEKILQRIPPYCRLTLHEGRLEFAWQKLFNRLSQVMDTEVEVVKKDLEDLLIK